jgi:transcriptional regulator with XRE-family HTH domain
VQVGNRIRIRRMLIGMSQDHLGDLLGLTFQQVQKYEKGVNRIGAGRLYEVARILNVPVNFFYGVLATELPPNANETDVSVRPVMEFVASGEEHQFVAALAAHWDPLEQTRLPGPSLTRYGEMARHDPRLQERSPIPSRRPRMGLYGPPRGRGAGRTGLSWQPAKCADTVRTQMGTLPGGVGLAPISLILLLVPTTGLEPVTP